MARRSSAASQKLIEFLLADLRRNLSPENTRDAALITSISEQVVAHYDSLDSERETPEARIAHANHLLQVATIYRGMARFEEALALSQRSLDLRLAAGSKLDRDILDTLDLLGICHNQLGHYPEAEQFYLRAIDETEKLPDAAVARTGRATGRLADFYRQMGRYVEADAMHRRAIAIAEAKVAPDDLELARAITTTAN